LAKSIADVALAGRIKTLEDLHNAQLDGVSIKDKLLDTVAKIGEKIEVKKYEVLEGEGVVAYIHMGYRMGVLVQLNLALNEAITT
jgi:elongation factor Ts